MELKCNAVAVIFVGLVISEIAESLTGQFFIAGVPRDNSVDIPALRSPGTAGGAGAGMRSALLLNGGGRSKGAALCPPQSLSSLRQPGKSISSSLLHLLVRIISCKFQLRKHFL